MFLSIKVVCKFLLVKSRISTFHQWLKNCCFADVDECSANSLLCRNGLCINMNGTYRCECNPGFQVSSDGKSCSRGQYATPVRTFLSIEISLTLKTGCQSRKWLSPREIHFTPFFKQFSCFPGVDPCSQSGVCENGACVNTRDGFTCQCRSGYTLTSDKRTCTGEHDSFHST